jgi:drug/metabolite transporter, DME family
MSDPAKPTTAEVPSLSHGRARLYVLLAALMWSTSGAFGHVLSKDTIFHLNQPPIDALPIAFYRAACAAAILWPFLRRRDVSFRPMMIFTALTFAVMSALFITALARGSAANAILLQYTAPMWMYLACVFLLKEPADRSGFVAVLLGLAGVLCIVVDGWSDDKLDIVLIALGSGITYAGVLIGLRVMRDSAPRWLTTVNLTTTALLLLPFACLKPLPSWPQLGVLFLYGALQMALPYWLIARGLQRISPQEAGTLTLLEPLLNPVWARLVAPEAEPLRWFTLAGGALILLALVTSLLAKHEPPGGKPAVLPTIEEGSKPRVHGAGGST